MGFVEKLKKIKNAQNTLVRDFTENAEEKMVRISGRVNKDEDAGDVEVTDRLGKWMDQKGYLYLMLSTQKYRERVIDYYNYSEKVIREICGMARDEDIMSGQKISDNTKQAYRVVKCLDELAECLDVKSSSYSTSIPISYRLYNFRNSTFKENEQVYKMEDVLIDTNRYYNQNQPLEIGEQDIIEYCNDEDTETIFGEYSNYIYDELDDQSTLDIVWTATGTVIYKGVEMTVDEAVGLISGEGYSDKIVREQLNEIINSVIGSSKNCQTFIKDHNEAKEKMEALIESYLEDEEKNKENQFVEFVNLMGGMAAVKQMLKTCPELLDYLYNDYAKGREMILQVKETCERSGNKEMQKAADKLLKEYNNKWAGVLDRGIDFSADMIEGTVKKSLDDWIEENCENFSVISEIIDMTGIEDNVEAEHKLIALRKIENDLQTAYKNAIKKIDSGNYTEDDLKYAKNMFDVLKKTEISIYKTYREMCADDPLEQIYLNKQINKLESMNMKYYSNCTVNS